MIYKPDKQVLFKNYNYSIDNLYEKLTKLSGIILADVEKKKFTSEEPLVLLKWEKKGGWVTGREKGGLGV